MIDPRNVGKSKYVIQARQHIQHGKPHSPQGHPPMTPPEVWRWLIENLTAELLKQREIGFKASDGRSAIPVVAAENARLHLRQESQVRRQAR